MTEKQIRANVRPLMYTRLRLGEFDPDSKNPYASIDVSIVQADEHRQLAINAAMMSFVLLKNMEGFLPIKPKFKKIAVSDVTVQYAVVVHLFIYVGAKE